MAMLNNINAFNNVLNEVIITSLRQVKYMSLLAYARQPVTRLMMINIISPFIQVLHDNDIVHYNDIVYDNDIVYFRERLLDEDNDITSDIDTELVRTIVERSENNERLGRVIDLVIERCKAMF